MVESGVIRVKASYEASFGQARDKAAVEEWLTDAVVTTGFDDRIVQNSGRRVIPRIWVIQGEIDVG